MTTPAAATMNLTRADVARFDRFRIPAELIEAAQIRRVTDREAHDLGIRFRGRSVRHRISN